MQVKRVIPAAPLTGQAAGLSGSAISSGNRSAFFARSGRPSGSLSGGSALLGDDQPVSLLGSDFVSKIIGGFDDSGSIGSGKNEDGIFNPVLQSLNAQFLGAQL